MSLREVDSVADNIELVEFAAQDRIVLGAVNILTGEEGSGKTTLMSYLAAQWSRGKVKGSLYGKPCNVRIVGAEDSFNRVWLPKLVAADANLSKVKLIERDDLRTLDIREDFVDLAKMCKRKRVKVLVFDAFIDNLGPDTDSNHGRQVRRDMTPLRVVAEKLNIAIIVCLHTNKRGTTFRQIMQGSSAFNQVTRSTLWLTRVPDGEDNERVIMTGKANYAPTGNPWEFKILSAEVEARVGLVRTTRALFNGRVSDITLEDCLKATAGANENGHATERKNKSAAARLIRDLLADGKSHKSSDIVAACEEEGFKYRTILRARDDLAVLVSHTKTSPPTVLWRLGV
jgi:AAA domain